MKNGRRNNSSEERGNADTADVSGIAIDDGNYVRTNDGSAETNAIGIDGNENIVSTTMRSGTQSERNDNSVEITAGYYFTPNGKIERIPSGHYIGSDGRLRKRRIKRTTDNAVDGNENRNRTETSNEQEFSSESSIWEKPLKERGKRGRKAKVTEAAQRLTVVTLLASATSALFTSIALLTKHDHWSLVSEESKALSESLNEAFATLSTKHYEFIIAILEKWVPWINLIFVASAIILPRIEESAKLSEAKRYQPNQTGDSGDAGAKTDTSYRAPSLGWNGR